MSLEIITVELLPKFTGLDDASARSYFKAEYTIRPLLNSRIITPFEQLLKAHPGFDEEHLPEQSTTTELKLGDITFRILCEKRKKKPKLSDVFDGLATFLQFLKKDYDAGVQRKGVRTFDDVPYILLDDIFTQLEDLKKEVTENEVKHTLSHDYNGLLCESIVVPLLSVPTLCECDALRFAQAEALEKAINDRTVKPFNDALKKQTGYSTECIPAKMETKVVPVSKHLFMIQSIPERTVRYADIFSSLTKEKPQRVTARSKIGDLVMIKDGLDLRPDLDNLYQPRTDRDQKYIRIDGLLERLKQLKEENTNPSLNQKISHYPAI